MDIQLDKILFQVINFAVVMAALRWFVYKPVLQMLEDRASKIKDGLDAAEKNLKIQDDLEKKQILADKQAKADANKIVEDAQKEAKEIIRQAKTDAKAEAKTVMAKEQEAFKAEMTKLQADFKKQASQIVSDATEAVLRESLTVKVQNDLIDAQIKQLSTKHFG